MKISIVVSKNLNSGQKANVSAIIMGQLGLDVSEIYMDSIIDASGTKHAGISVNVVILDGNTNQLLALTASARKSNVICVAFSAIGQSLSNNYTDYKQKILTSNTEDTQLIGVGICGDDEIVRLLTKKFSLVK